MSKLESSAAGYFAAIEHRAAVQRGAYRLLDCIITDWLADYATGGRWPHGEVSLDVRLELDRIRNLVAAAAGEPEP